MSETTGMEVESALFCFLDLTVLTPWPQLVGTAKLGADGRNRVEEGDVAFWHEGGGIHWVRAEVWRKKPGEQT